MPKNLVIVESPAKAKTIKKYLGSEFEVLSSMGHIRDLPKSGIGVDIENNFTPEYVISPDKTKVVSTLKKAAKGKEVWLATDEDREGEAISWHLCETLDLNPQKTKRIVFHEITKPAIDEAIKTPRTINMNMVNAQQARRVLDRLVGYELSPVLWKKIQTGLSAGRVQSVAVRLIVDKEREIEAFDQKSDYKVTAIFKTHQGDELKTELNQRIQDSKRAESFLKNLINKQFNVQAVIKKPAKKSPAPPFTTSTLQQAAANRLGYSVKQTMLLAQKLYEAGHITYMRTDSVNLSQTAINQAAKVITTEYGKEYLKTRQYKSKSTNAQEAHEAIRPTNFNLKKVGDDPKQVKLYELIWARALASQMAEAELEKTEIQIATTDISEVFVSKGEIIVFPGYLQAYQSANQKEPIIMPKLQQNDALELLEANATQTFVRPPARYTEASLVKKLEAEGIGRPSTYAPTISTIQTRGYVKKSDGIGKTRTIKMFSLSKNKIKKQEIIEKYDTDRNRLLPTDIGTVVTDFLIKHFSQILDYQFTAKIEAEFDEIAAAKLPWQRMIANFYGPFHKLITKSENITRQEASQSRLLGYDPKTNKPVIARLGRYGAMIQIGETESEEKPRFAPMPEGRKIADVTLEEALKMFELPRVVGKSAKGEKIVANIGRFGPYLKVGNVNISIKNYDPFNITEEEANMLIAENEEKLKKMVIADFKEAKIRILNGRFGPYITDGKTNVKIPKDTDPKKISLKEAERLISEKKK